MRVRHIIALLVVATLAYLLLWPTGHVFESYTAPGTQALSVDLAADRTLDGLRRTTTLSEGPEDIAIDSAGAIYTGTADGHIWVLEPGADVWRPIAVTMGRPLGLAFDATQRWLYIADGERGLMRTDREGHLERIVDTAADGRDLGLVDDLAVAPTGEVYLTTASDNWDLDGVTGAALAHDRTGRLFRYDPGDASLSLVADSLLFANGVAVSPDGRYVYVAQTTDYSVLRYRIDGGGAAGGTAERFAERLPGFPDGLNFDDRGRLWVSIVGPRDGRLDAMADYPMLREATYKLPDDFRPAPRYGTTLLALDRDGQVVAHLGGSDDEDAYRGITNAVWRGDTVYVGSLVERAVGWVVVGG